MSLANAPFLLSYNIAPEVAAFSTLRHGGGRSLGAYGEMNINPFCGDDAEAVKANRALLAEALGLSARDIVLPHQVHDTQVYVVGDEYIAADEAERARLIDGIDALVTTQTGLCIGVSTADCVPVILYDTHLRVAAAVHAGWRGTVARIVSKTLAVMATNFGSQPQDIKAVIGPSISQVAFEVGDEVYDHFCAQGFPMSAIATKIHSRWHIDLWKANELQLTSFGIPLPNIHTTNICTHTRHDEFFSARRLSINSGRIYTGITIL